MKRYCRTHFDMPPPYTAWSGLLNINVLSVH
jgi:hypothetical protein